MEFENLLKLVDAVADSGLDSFYYEQNGTKIKLKKTAGTVSPKTKILDTIQTETTVKAQEQPKVRAEEEPSGHVTWIKSPLVGVFYEAPGEDAKPFVSVGDRVKKGQILGIIEAMKLMNEIESECDGTVKEISVKNGDSVEYGQTLFVIED